MTKTIRQLSKKLGAALRNKRFTLAVAESCTGGQICAAITGIAGSSDYFSGGVISYSNSIKHELLAVPEHTLSRFGAVSRETAMAMSRGIQKLMKADCTIAVSGIAGPGGGTKEKPVGLVYLGIAVKKSGKTFKLHLCGSRKVIQEEAVKTAILYLIREL